MCKSFFCVDYGEETLIVLLVIEWYAKIWLGKMVRFVKYYLAKHNFFLKKYT